MLPRGWADVCKRKKKNSSESNHGDLLKRNQMVNPGDGRDLSNVELNEKLGAGTKKKLQLPGLLLPSELAEAGKNC